MKYCFIIGENCRSLSPLMHNSALKAAGIGSEFAYGLMYVTPSTLPEFINWVRQRDEVVGLSVTIPLKELITEHLDEVAECALAVGSVNTVVKNGDKLCGYNTDYLGVLNPIKDRLKRKKIKPQSTACLNAVILGMGGAGKGALYALELLGIEEIIVGVRSPEKLNLPYPVMPFDEACKLAGCTDIVINATSIGDEQLFATDQFEGVYLDMVYTPLFTPTLRAIMGGCDFDGETSRESPAQRATVKLTEAELLATYRSSSCIHGLEMLVAQGVRQFELFTGHSPDVQLLTECLITAK